ncbi:hypothetical protein [Glutamicibacter sp.]|jgi:hypothetical protein|uniref:hypothetical protein n=1 Tax=Glutamicibacter sp. TaxID=1931995 RepID=UPI002B47407D|nr:hypothetical protein [Glutamicibacter sp.]HJX79124.1 hypothetical protein [Glutamicibacter sp.]
MATEEPPKVEKTEQEKLIDELQAKITLQDKEIHHFRMLLVNIIEFLDGEENKFSNLRNNSKQLIADSPMNKQARGPIVQQNT